MNPNQLHKDVEPLIADTRRKFESYLHRQGAWMESEQLQSDANLAYCEAAKSYDPSRKVKFSTWVCYKVQKNLLESHRQATRKYHPVETLADNTPVPEQLDIERLKVELSPDAARCVELVLERPPDVLLNIGPRQSTAERISNAVVEFLLAVGWTGSRIASAWSEVKEALI